MNPPTTRVAVLVGGWLTVLGAVPPLLLALWFAVQDGGQQGEWLDGVGLALAAVLVAVAAVPALVGWVALSRWRERSRDAAWLLAAFGIVVALVGWPATGAVGLAVGATMVLGGLLVAAVAFLGLVVAPHEGDRELAR
jgi:hypothetical protein